MSDWPRKKQEDHTERIHVVQQGFIYKYTNNSRRKSWSSVYMRLYNNSLVQVYKNENERKANASWILRDALNQMHFGSEACRFTDKPTLPYTAAEHTLLRIQLETAANVFPSSPSFSVQWLLFHNTSHLRVWRDAILNTLPEKGDDHSSAFCSTGPPSTPTASRPINIAVPGAQYSPVAEVSPTQEVTHTPENTHCALQPLYHHRYKSVRMRRSSSRSSAGHSDDASPSPAYTPSPAHINTPTHLHSPTYTHATPQVFFPPNTPPVGMTEDIRQRDHWGTASSRLVHDADVQDCLQDEEIYAHPVFPPQPVASSAPDYARFRQAIPYDTGAQPADLQDHRELNTTGDAGVTEHIYDNAIAPVHSSSPRVVDQDDGDVVAAHHYHNQQRDGTDDALLEGCGDDRPASEETEAPPLITIDEGSESDGGKDGETPVAGAGGEMAGLYVGDHRNNEEGEGYVVGDVETRGLVPTAPPRWSSLSRSNSLKRGSRRISTFSEPPPPYDAIHQELYPELPADVPIMNGFVTCIYDQFHYYDDQVQYWSPIMPIPSWVNLGSSFTPYPHGLVVAGASCPQSGMRVSLLNFVTKQEISLHDLPVAVRATALHFRDKCVYVISGTHYTGNNTWAKKPVAYCLDTTEHLPNWTKLQPMKHAVTRPLVVGYSKCIVVLGGFDISTTSSRHAQIYNTRTRRWMYLADLPNPCEAVHAGAVTYKDKVMVLTPTCCMEYFNGEDMWSVRRYKKTTDAVKPVVLDEEDDIVACVHSGNRKYIQTYNKENNKWTRRNIDVTNEWSTYYFFVTNYIEHVECL